MSKFKRIIKYSFAPLLISTLLVGCSDSEVSNSKELKDNDAVATLKGDKINKEELFDNLMIRYGRSTIQELLLEKISIAEGEKLKISVSDEEIEDQLNIMINSYGGEEAFSEMIEEYNYTLDLTKDILKNSLLMEKLIKDSMDYSKEDLKKYFEENSDQFTTEDTADAYHILVDDEKKAKELISELNDSKNKLETFKKLAKANSKDSSTASDSGYLGTFNRGTMVEEFSDATFELENNTYTTKPVKTSYGYHIIYLVSKTINEKNTFEDLIDDVEASYIDANYDESYSTWCKEKLKEYNAKDLFNNVNYKELFSDDNPDEVSEDLSTDVKENSTDKSKEDSSSKN